MLYNFIHSLCRRMLKIWNQNKFSPFQELISVWKLRHNFWSTVVLVVLYQCTSNRGQLVSRPQKQLIWKFTSIYSLFITGKDIMPIFFSSLWWFFTELDTSLWQSDIFLSLRPVARDFCIRIISLSNVLWLTQFWA